MLVRENNYDKEKKSLSHDTSYDISDYLNMQEDTYTFSKKKFFMRIILSITIFIVASILPIVTSLIVSIISTVALIITLMTILIIWQPIDQ